MMNSQSASTILPEEDLLNTVLCNLKRTVREYTTATTESACPTIRQMFTDLTNDTLRLQGDLFHLMQQQNQYTPASKASRQEVDKQLQQSRKTQQQSHQFVQQRLGGVGQTQPLPQNQPNSQNSNYM
ncbi:spore coat protein CotF [Paenibacillus sp. DS2015]